MDVGVATGTVIAEKYRVERPLGSGGMGQVVAVTHLQLHRPFALKLLPADAEASTRERFLREARASARIQSPHVVKVFDVGERSDGAPFLVMELLEGEDLDQRLLRLGPFAIEEAVSYLRQACLGLQAAHDLGIVHRDVKPANLFLCRIDDGSWGIKVVDFGISKEALTMPGNQIGLTQSGAVLGTPRYMSPEQLVSSRRVDARTDVWSLGVTLYELLSGRPAFPSESIAELCTMIFRDEPPPLAELRPDVSPALVEVVARCLAKDAGARFTTAMDLAAALDAAQRRSGSSLGHALTVPMQAIADVTEEMAHPPPEASGSHPGLVLASSTGPTDPAAPLVEEVPRRSPWLAVAVIAVMVLAVVAAGFAL